MSEPVHSTSTPGMVTTAPTITLPGVSTVTPPSTGAPTPPATPADPPPAGQQPPASDPAATDGSEHLGDPGKRALDRMKAERDDAQRRLREFEDRDLSELQKAQRDREEALARLQEVEREAIRNRVALAKQIPAEIAAGPPPNAGEAELAAYADALIAWRGNVPPTTPRPDPGQGPRPSTPEAETQAEYFKFFPDEAPKAR